jgi:DNA-binding LytR/AlgR family response regulator
MRIAICDDIRIHAEELAQLVVRYYGETVNLSIFVSGKSLISAISNQSKPPFDLIFLDILMPGLDGVTVAKNIRQCNDEVPIIFVTSTSDYSIKGYQVDASAYIMKPINTNELKQALDRIEKRRARIGDERIVVTSDGVVMSIPFSEILSVEKTGRKTVITRTSGVPIHTIQPIREIARQFEKHNQFTIVSQSNYVNLTNALGFEKKARIVNMCDGSVVNVSRTHMKTLLDRFLEKNFGRK